MSLNTDMEPDESGLTNAVIGRLGAILKDTANALHGGPMKNGWWSWHDLADRAKALVKENRMLKAENKKLHTRLNKIMDGGRKR
jgi:hypothetical protein